MNFPRNDFDSGRAAQLNETDQLWARQQLAKVLEVLGPASTNPIIETDIDEARRVDLILKARIRRRRFLNPNLFADPAWDMLLELYSAKLGQRRVSVSSLCIASDVPATTALRWIDTLRREQLVERMPDPRDRRRIFVNLTTKGCEAMRSYFSEIPATVSSL